MFARTKTPERLFVSVVVVAVAVALAACGGAASGVVEPPSAGQRSATSIFLAVQRARADAIETSLPTSEKAVGRYVTGAEAACPGVAAGSPRNGEGDELADDVLVSVENEFNRSDTRAEAVFAAGVSDLHWPDPTVTMLVRRLAAYERAVAGLAPLDICGVFAAWERSGYRTIPPAARRLERASRSLSSGAVTRCRRQPTSGRIICSLVPQRKQAEDGTGSLRLTMATIAKLLRPYEEPGQRTTMIETRTIEARLATAGRTTLTSAASVLTQGLDLDRLTLRLFLASLRELVNG